MHPPVEGVLVIVALQGAEHDDRAAGIARVSGQEVRHRPEISAERSVGGPGSARAVEDEAAALVDLVEDVQAGAAVLASDLQLMAPVRPGQVIGDMARGVDAAQRLCGADVIEAVDGDLRRTDQGRVGDAGVQSERERVEAGVRVVERLQEVVHAERHLVDQGWRKDGILHDRDVVHVAGRDLEEVADVRADVGGLRAGSAEVARGDGVLLVEVMVDLDDSVVAVVVVAPVGEIVILDGRAGAGGRRPDGLQVDGDRIHGNAILRQYAPAGRHPGIGRNRVEKRVVGVGELRFAVEEVERLVLRDRTADREAELVIADDLFRAGGRLKRRPRGQRFIAIEVISAAVERVGARFDHHVDAGSAVAAGLGAGIALHGELVDGFDGQERARDAGHATLVNGGGVLEGVVVIGAIDLVVVAAGAHAVDRSAGGRDAGSQFDHLAEVAAVHGKVGDGLGVHHTDQSGRGCLQGGGGGGNFNHLLLLRDAQLQVQVRRPGDGDLHVVDLSRFEARLQDRDRVLAHGEVREEILALGIGDGGAGEAGRRAVQRDRGAGNRRAGTVGHYSGNAAAKGLCAECAGK